MAPADGTAGVVTSRGNGVQSGAGRKDGEPSVSYSLEEVAQHKYPDDCWIIIRGKVYDVTNWVPKHPGGSLIYVKAGKDCTQLFDSCHPLYVRKMLSKFYKGEATLPPGSDVAWKQMLEYQAKGKESDFYTAVKERVEKHFKERKMDPRFHPHMIMKSCLILAGYLFCYWGTFFASWSLGPRLACAIFMGFFAAEVGVSIQHDANHGAYTKWPALGYLMGATLDFVGASSFMWRQQHVVGHHVFTNVDTHDPDIRVKDPDVRRVTATQPWRWYHAYQHIYLGFLYGLLSVKSVLLDDFQAYFRGSIGSVQLAPMTVLESGVFWGFKALYAAYMFVLPLVAGTVALPAAILLFAISQFVCGWILAFMFQVAHVVGEAEFPTTQTSAANRSMPKDWAELQVATTVDFSPCSWFWTHVSGGLNHQVEHHLFPSVCHVHYPSIQPIVEATCKEFGLQYRAFPTFRAALMAHFRHMRQVGLAGFSLRLGDA